MSLNSKGSEVRVSMNTRDSVDAAVKLASCSSKMLVKGAAVYFSKRTQKPKGRCCK